jgi:hypothetical protein
MKEYKEEHNACLIFDNDSGVKDVEKAKWSFSTFDFMNIRGLLIY